MFDNRITLAVDTLQERLDTLPAEKLASLDKIATLEMSDRLEFAEIPTRLYAAGVVDLNAANTLHAIFRDFDSCSVAQRMVYMQVMQEAYGRV